MCFFFFFPEQGAGGYSPSYSNFRPRLREEEYGNHKSRKRRDTDQNMSSPSGLAVSPAYESPLSQNSVNNGQLSPRLNELKVYRDGDDDVNLSSIRLALQHALPFVCLFFSSLEIITDSMQILPELQVGVK